MDRSEISTYTSGYRIRFTRNITKNDFLLMMTRLGEVFGDGYEFAPEPITEGGIIMVRFPGKTEGMLKTMRLGLFHPRWVWVNPNYREEWTSNEEIIIPCNLKEWYGTLLKAFKHAPAWSQDELTKFRFVFTEFGIKIKNKRVNLRGY